MAVKNLLIRGGADFSGIKNEMAKTQKTLNDFQSNVSKAMKGIGLVLGSLAIGKLVKDSTEMAMSVESSINQINRTMGSSAAGFAKWANEQAKGYGMAKSEAFKYGAVYSNLIGGFTKDTAETTRYTEDLLKASAVVASSTGRTMEDTMDRIRSGLLGNTEAIEDLGINVNVAMLESTKAFQQFANGKSWKQLDFQTQQQIRLMAILEQANLKYGDSLANTTATQLQMFRAELKNIQLSLGQAFMPILNTILPLLTALASRVAYVMGIIAQFSQALFGKSSNAKAQTKAINTQTQAVSGLGDAMDNVGGSAKKAGKKAKGSLASFDEINSMSKSGSESGGSDGVGNGAGGSSISVPPIDTGGFASSTLEVSDKVKAMADKVKGVLSQLATFFSENKDIIISVISGLVAGFASFQIISNWSKIVTIFKGVITALSTAIGGISLPILAVAAVIALLVGNLVYLWRTNEDFRNSVLEVWEQIKTFVTTVASDMWTILKDLWDTYGQTLIDNLKGFMKSIQDLIISIWEGFLKPVITNALEMLSWLWDKHLKDLVKQVGEFIMKLVNGVLELWNKFFAPIIGFLIDIFGPVVAEVFNYLVDSIGTAIAVISDVLKGLLRILGGIIDFIVGVFTGNWGKAWNGIKDIFGGVFDSLVGIAKWPLNLIIDLVNGAIGGINSMISALNKVPGINIGTIPKIPKLAKGGIVSSPTIAMVGEAGKEAVMPLENNTGWIDELASKLNAQGGSGGPMELTINFGSTNIFRGIIDGINKAQRQAGKTLIEV